MLHRFYLAALAAAMFAAAGPLPTGEGGAGEIPVSNFDSPGKELPDGWRHQTFDPKKVPRASEYDLVEMGGETVLRGRTQSGASLVYRRVEVDWRTHPVIAWRWRVDQVFDKEDEPSKAGDDYPARLYIGFKYDPERVNWLQRRLFERARRQSDDNSYPPLYTLNYVWATKEPPGAAYDNPYQSRAKMLVARSGRKGLRQWHEEARNYVEGFREIVGEEPPEVEFVALMIDGDDTESSGVSYFADIRFLAEMPEGGAENDNAGRKNP